MSYKNEIPPLLDTPNLVPNRSLTPTEIPVLNEEEILKIRALIATQCPPLENTHINANRDNMVINTAFVPPAPSYSPPYQPSYPQPAPPSYPPVYSSYDPNVPKPHHPFQPPLPFPPSSSFPLQPPLLLSKPMFNPSAISEPIPPQIPIVRDASSQPSRQKKKRIITFDPSQESLEILHRGLENIQKHHRCEENVSILHLHFQILLYNLDYTKPPQNWKNKKEFSFGEFLCTLLLKPELVPGMYNIIIKDFNKMLKEHNTGLLLFFLCTTVNNYPLAQFKDLLQKSFADGNHNTITFLEPLSSNSAILQKQRNKMKFKFLQLLQVMFLEMQKVTFNVILDLSKEEILVDFNHTLMINKFFFKKDILEIYQKLYSTKFRIYDISKDSYLQMLRKEKEGIPTTDLFRQDLQERKIKDYIEKKETPSEKENSNATSEGL